MDYLKLPKYIYIVIVSTLEKHDFQIQATFLSLMATLILTPLIFVILVLCGIYKALIEWSLSKLFAPDFVTIMEGIDSICCNQVNCIPNVLLLVDSQDDIPTLHAKMVRKVSIAMTSEHQKLFYSRDTFMGYHYFVSNQLKPHDYVIVSETRATITTKADLSQAFHAIDAQAMPDNGRALLQIVLFRSSVQLGDEILKMVAFRMHHSLGDGKTIMNLFASVFGYVQSSTLKVPLNGRKSPTPIRKIVPEVMRLKDWPCGLRDDNALRGYNLSENKHIVWFSDTDKGCMNKIRHLRCTLPGVTFLDVVNTCIASSLCDHYERNGLPIPRTVIGGVILSPAIYSFSYGDGRFTINNRFSAAAIHLPISDCKLQTRLTIIKKEYEKIRKYADIQKLSSPMKTTTNRSLEKTTSTKILIFNFWAAQTLCATIPYPIVRRVCEKVPVTVGISSLPGCDQFTLFDGSPVKDFIFMLPNSPKCGLHFVIYTYDGNFRIALSADNSVIKNYQDAQMILDGIIGYLNELYQLSVNGSLQV